MSAEHESHGGESFGIARKMEEVSQSIFDLLAVIITAGILLAVPDGHHH